MRIRNMLLAGLAAAGVGAYATVGRAAMLRWGATAEEAVEPLPGDDLVPGAGYVTTRAVTIDAPPADVWPWLVQMGQGRGGLYSYDRLENLFGLDFHSADRVIPELQHLKLGDDISLAPDNGLPLGVTILDPERMLVIRSRNRETGATQPPGDYRKGEIACTWGWYLTPLDGDRTRLVARFRADWRPSLAATFMQPLTLEPAHFVMERKMLLGIKERAERLATRLHQAVDWAERARAAA